LQGDLGGYDASPGGPNSGGPSGNRVGETDKNKQRAADIMTGKTNVSSPTGDTVGYGTEPSPFQQAIDFYNKLPTPLNIAKKVLTKLGPFNNKDFYNEKVVPAGKTNLSYDDYMSARMAGTIDAYGNPIDTEQGGNNNQSASNTGILQVKEITPIGEEVIDSTDQNMNFNFGTFSNPIYKKDLV